MKLFLLLLIAFLALVYIYTFIKIRKKRKNPTKSAVEDFNEKYLSSKVPLVNNNHHLPANYKKQITKYNSTIDYIDKSEL